MCLCLLLMLYCIEDISNLMLRVFVCFVKNSAMGCVYWDF